MRPVPVTRIHGTLAAGNADWRGRNDLQIQLLPLDRRPLCVFRSRHRRTNQHGRRLFRDPPGVPRFLMLVAFSRAGFLQGTPQAGIMVFPPGDAQAEGSDRIGAMVRVDVTEKPVEISLQFHRAMDISGSIQIEQAANTTNPVTPSQIRLQLTAEHPLAAGRRVQYSSVTTGASA